MKRVFAYVTVFLLVLSSALLLNGCEIKEPGSFSQDSKSTEELAEDTGVVVETEEKSPREEVVPGEFIISLQAASDLNSLSAGEAGEKMATELKKHQDVFADSEFEMRSLFREALGESSESFTASTSINSEIVDLAAGSGYLNLVRYPSEKFADRDEAREKMIEMLESEGIEVNYIEPNYRVEIAGVEAAEFEEQEPWNLEMIKAPAAWEHESGSEDLSIGIIDTGIDYNNPYIEDYVDRDGGRNFVRENDVINIDDIMDENGHGTHVAGIIASQSELSGVMQEAALIPLRVLDASGWGSIDGVVEALVYSLIEEIDIINMSLGLENRPETLENIVRKVNEHDIIQVAAAGNKDEENVLYPAAFSRVVAVSAVNDKKKLAGYSNFGTEIDVTAPGSEILSTFSETVAQNNEDARVNEHFGFLSGTSMAAPHVAGKAGLIRSFNPEISAENIQLLIEDSAREMDNELHFGGGMIDCYRAVGGRLIEPYF